MRELDLDIDLADVLEHMNEGLQVIGPDFRYRYVNAVAALHGRCRREELIGRTMMECYPGIEHTEMFSMIQALVEEGGSRSLENEFTFPDGSRGWFELRMVRVPQGVLLLSIDISSRKHLEAQVHRMHRMEAIGQLAGGVSHDFNNLLTVIQSYASFIHEDLPEASALRADAEHIISAAKRGGELTQRLLAFARQLPETSGGTVAVTSALADVTTMLRRTLGEHITLTVDIPQGLGHVSIDASAFDQIVVNLVVNARDAIGESGHVTIEAELGEVAEAWALARGVTLTPGQYVVISVTDSGTGMTSEVLERLFEPFFTTKEEGVGTGLGLATCWGLVRQAGGTITVYSEVGAGTTFRVYLPRAAGAAAAPAPPQATFLQGAGEQLLVVEDQVEVREVVVRTLRAGGYRVLEAATVDEALALAADLGDRLELLVTDVVMPKMSGIVLAGQLRRLRPLLRVLLISGFTPRSLAHQGLQPSDRMLVKPFSPVTLLRAVRSALDAAP